MASNDQRLKGFFEQYISYEGRVKIINRKSIELKRRMMVGELLDQMLSQDVLPSQEMKNDITGQGQGSLTTEKQAEQILNIVRIVDDKKYVTFLKILKDIQGDLAKTLTGEYYDLLSLDDLEERFENLPATLNKQPTSSLPKAMESGKDYTEYIGLYIEKDKRGKILGEQDEFIAKYLNPTQILPKLVSKGVISQDEKWEIEGAGTGFKVPKLQTKDLQKMLGTLDEEKYVDFLDALFTTQKDIARMLTGGKYIPGKELRLHVDL